MYGKDKQRFEDRIFRAYGILTNARMISTEESLHLLSNVRMGINMGIIKDISIEKVNELMIIIQPAFLEKLSERTRVRREMPKGQDCYGEVRRMMKG